MAKHVYGRVTDTRYHFGGHELFRGQAVKMTSEQAAAVKAVKTVGDDGEPHASIEFVKFEDVKDQPIFDMTGGAPETTDAAAPKA